MNYNRNSRKSIPFSLEGFSSQYSNDRPSMVDYDEYIRNETVRQPIFKLEFLTKTDETPYESIEDTMLNSDGSLNVTLNNGVRRTCSITLVNQNNKYTSLFSNLSLGSKFSLSLGYIIYGTPFYFPQGVFVFDNPTLISDLDNKVITISGTDKWSMINGTNGGILQATYQIEIGSTLRNIVKQTLSLDVVYDPIVPNIDDSIADFAMPYIITKEAGSTVSEILLEVVATVNAYIYYDVNGVCNIRAFEYDEDKGSLHHFYKDDMNFLNVSKTYGYDVLCNAVFVIADNLQNDKVPIYAEAINNDASDPNSVPNLGYKKYKPITEFVEGITTQSLADQRCRYELKLIASKQSQISISARPLYHMLENQIIEVTDEYISANVERFLINGFTLPISTDGTMTIQATKGMGYI